MIKTKYLILGAGIGGLAAAAELKSKGIEDFLVLERAKSVPMNLHNGLHYLHSSDFGTPFPFKFKKVILTEEIWNVRKDEFSKTPNLPQMLEYSKKIMENLRHPSSIMDPGKINEVWVPESNVMNDLLLAYADYIGIEHFIFDSSLVSLSLGLNESLTSDGTRIHYDQCISTIPIYDFQKMCKINSSYEFKHKTIHITNYYARNIVPNWLIVLYISDPKFKPYRITVMNNIISMESIEPMTPDDEVIVKYHCQDLFDYDLESKSSYAWETGRIFGLSNEQREEMVIFYKQWGVNLLGRFANWNGKLRMDTTVLQAKKIVKEITK